MLVRGAPHSLASAPADKTSSTRNSSRRTSPGCIGASCLAIGFSSGLSDWRSMEWTNATSWFYGLAPFAQFSASRSRGRHCERQRSNPGATKTILDCFVALLLAMTILQQSCAARSRRAVAWSARRRGKSAAPLTALHACHAQIARRANSSQPDGIAADPKSDLGLTSSRSSWGALAIVTDVGRDAVDADSAQDERAASGRRNRVVLTPRRWRQACRSRPAGDSDKKARSLGRARYKP